MFPQHPHRHPHRHPLLQRLRHTLTCAFLPSLLLSAQPAQAEGSKDLTANGGDRPYLEQRTGTIAGIARTTVIKVYANVGETINLGSSATGKDPDGTTGTKPAATIKYKNPNGVPGDCGAGVGVITNRNAEVAGPRHPLTNTATDAFTPCIVTVATGEEGIWEIEFTSPDLSATQDPPPISATGNWTQPANVSWISAWDVTVRNTSGTALTGRAFANQLSLNVGGNSRSLSSKVYVQTADGYGYTIDMNGIDPFGFVFFANNKGFRNAAENPIYRSLQLTGNNPGDMPLGYSIHSPASPDNTTNTTHKIFFNATGPDTSMPASAKGPRGNTWLYLAPIPPPVPSALAFQGREGTPGQAGTNPLGGSFSFSSPQAGPFAITLDFNKNGIYGDGNDRTIVGTAIAGLNSVLWDGKDGDNAAVPASDTAYNSQVVLFAGEVHFPFIDPENNPKGLIINRVKDPGTTTNPPDPFEIFYNDRISGDYSLCAGQEVATNPVPTGLNCYGTAPNPRSGLNGVSSGTGAHPWSSNFGDRRGMDTWINYPSAFVQLAGGFVVREADLSITKTDGLTQVSQGASLSYTIVVRNSGPSNAVGATVRDTFPSSLENIAWTCSASTGSSCPTSGVGDINTTVDLLKDGTATFIISANVKPTATGTISNSAIVLRPNDVNDPNDPGRIGAGNNSATDTTAINPGPALPLVKRITRIHNSILNNYIDQIGGTGDTNDNNILWPNLTATAPKSDGTGSNTSFSNVLKGIIDGTTLKPKPGDEIEYSIYFLSSGGQTARKASICDFIPVNTTYVPNSLQLVSGTNAAMPITDGTTDTDGGFYPIGTPTANLPAACRTPGSNDTGRGAVFSLLGDIPNATSSGTPTNSYGYIRFRVKVN